MVHIVSQRARILIVDDDATFRLTTGAGDRWARRLADNRVVLAREQGDFRILSGL